MQPSDRCVEFLKRCEGFRAKPYKCAGLVWTVGYGTTVYPDGTRVHPADPAVARSAADGYLRRTVVRVWDDIDPAVGAAVTQGQCDALTSLGYNIGTTALRGSTLLRKLNAGDAAGASAEFPKWVKAAGKILPGLVARRKAERAMFDGEVSNG